MDVYTLFFILFFGATIIAIFVELKIRSKAAKEMDEIKKGKRQKIYITEGSIIKKNTFERKYFLLLFLIIIVLLAIVIIYYNKNTNPGLFLPYIVMLIFLPIIMIYKAIEKMIFKYKLKKYDYYFEEALLIGKYSTGDEGNKTYYLIFADEEKKVYTKYTDYLTAEVGDIYHLLNLGGNKYPFNSQMYQLEDESKIVRRINND